MMKVSWPIRLFRIRGDSMSPNLRDGDYVITNTWFYSPRIGDVVVVQHPTLGVVIKRVLRVIPHGIFLQGDNTLASMSPERIGLVSLGDVLGKVIKRVTPKH